MNKGKYITDNYEFNPGRFGGVIYESDFDTDYCPDHSKGSPLASRVVSAHNFDTFCIKMHKYRDNKVVENNA